MKRERGPCSVCGQRTVVRDGEAADGRPWYRCLNGRCVGSYTKGHQGKPWDTQPAKTKKEG